MALDYGLYRNPGGRVWLYEFKFRGVKHKGSTGHTSKTLAREWLKKHREELADLEVGIIRKDPPTLAQAIADYLDAHKGTTTQKHRNDFEALLTQHLSKALHLKVTAITTEVVEEARRNYLNTPWIPKGSKTEKMRSVGGWNNVLKHLRALYRREIRLKRVKHCPWDVAKEKPVKRPPVIVWLELVPHFLNAVDEVTSLTAAKHGALAVRMMLALGLREDEVMTACWESVDWHRDLFLPIGKSKVPREIPLGWLGPMLESHWNNVGRPTSGLILVRARSGKAHHSGFSARFVAAGGAAVGLPNVTPHDLRRTFASTHWEEGHSIAQIQAMMGHKSPTTTMGYIVTRPKGREAAQARVAQRLGLPIRSPSGPPQTDWPAPKRPITNTSTT